jgi:hypothetical protein
MKTGTLPGPTPKAGLPDEYAARTNPMPPVAKITAVSLLFIRASVPSMVAVDMQPMASAGKPSFTATSRMMRAASLMHRAADGCGESTMALRDLIEMRILKIAVEVGFVEGMMPQTTPRGLAISTTSFDSEMTPTVRRLRNAFHTSSAAKRFFSRLSSATPKPVSSTAIAPSRVASLSAACAIASQMRSIFV